ncbi:hypothetical protein HK099_005679, partial [Clydaea vesicula]
DIPSHNEKKNRKGKKRKKSDDTPIIENKKQQKGKPKSKKKPSEYFQDNILKDIHVYIDPNKGDLLYCLGANGKKLRYTQMQRRHESSSKKYELIRSKLEDKNKKLQKQDVYERNGKIEIQCFYKYSKISKNFGDSENTTVLVGDWSRSALKYQVPTKGKGFRDMFKKAGYQVCLVNEFLTSSICPGCKSRTLEAFKERQHFNSW